MTKSLTKLIACSRRSDRGDSANRYNRKKKRSLPSRRTLLSKHLEQATELKVHPSNYIFSKFFLVVIEQKKYKIFSGTVPRIDRFPFSIAMDAPLNILGFR